MSNEGHERCSECDAEGWCALYCEEKENEMPKMEMIDELEGQLMTIDDFATQVRIHAFVDDDGFGEWATIDGTSGIRIYPSMFLTAVAPTWATHVAWYNR